MFFLYTLLTTILVLFVVLFVYIYPEHRPKYYLIARFHTVLEFTLLSLIFSSFVYNKFISRLILFLIIPFTIFCIFDYLNAKSPSIAYLPLFVECSYFILAIIYLYYEKISSEDSGISLPSTFFFWLTVGFFINFSGNFSLFLYSNSATANDTDFKMNYTIIYSIVTVLKNILLSVAAAKIGKSLVNKEQKDDSNFDDYNYPINNLN